jgi:membrane protease YdiL (CAAX protease family)
LRLADRRALGYGLPSTDFRRALTRGFGLGVLILAALSIALWALDLRIPRFAGELPAVPKVLAQGLLGGLAVGFIEETFFRGAMYSAIRRGGGSRTAAVLLPSLLYAAMHFLKPQPFPAGAEVSLTTCLSSLGGAFPALFRLENLDSFAALALVGIFLGLVRLRTGHIAWCIGLHAGWVLVIKLTRSYSEVNPGASGAWLVGDYDGMIGWLAAGWIGALALVLWLGRQPGGTGRSPDARQIK